jgi:hypothetical protein
MSGRPNPLPRFYRWRTNALQAAVFALVTAVCGLTALMVSLVDRKGQVHADQP